MILSIFFNYFKGLLNRTKDWRVFGGHSLQMDWRSSSFSCRLLFILSIWQPGSTLIPSHEALRVTDNWNVKIYRVPFYLYDELIFNDYFLSLRIKAYVYFRTFLTRNFFIGVLDWEEWFAGLDDLEFLGKSGLISEGQLNHTYLIEGIIRYFHSRRLDCQWLFREFAGCLSGIVNSSDEKGTLGSTSMHNSIDS